MLGVDGACERAALCFRKPTWRSLIPGLHLGRARAVKYPYALGAVAALCAVGAPHLEARMVDARPAGPAAGLVVPAQRAALVAYATSFVGTPYRWGGASPGGFDCSGLTSYVYAKFGVRMAHYTGAQYTAYRKVPRNRLRPGDLVFFAGLGHMGIYVGKGRFIHAPRAGDHVRISKLSESWYAQRYVGAVRPPFPRSASSTMGPSTRNPVGIRKPNSSASSA